MTTTDLTQVAWDLSHLLDGQGEEAIDAYLDRADRAADRLAARRGQVASFDQGEIRAFMEEMAELEELVGRAQAYASLRFATATAEPARGALLQKVQERVTAVSTKLVFFEVEWAALSDEQVADLLRAEGIDFCRHHLQNARRYRQHVLSESEEKILTEKSVTGRGAWNRLFSQLTSAVEVNLDGRTTGLEEALSELGNPDRERRRAAAEAVTAGLAPGLPTRAFIFNTLLLDKSVDDRLRHYDHWLASRNLANEASDDSVQALVQAVRNRFDVPQRWYSLKAQLLGVERLADYDRLASVAEEDTQVPWDEARTIVIDSYASFSPSMAEVAERFFDEHWIDAPVRPGKRGGAFCSYTVPSVHPYVMLNYTSRPTDVLTLAHELGHGLHAYLARHQGPFHQSTPLTLAETASVFGETVVFGRLLGEAPDPEARLSLLAANLDGQVATVFRQTAMNQFEDRAHRARRSEGELSAERIGDIWAETQSELLGDSVTITEGYRTWWSYIPHFIGTPGYVYAYSYGQLLALSVYRQYTEQGSDFVPRYLHLLESGGSDRPEALAKIVGCDLADPGFWDGGLAIIEEQLEEAETVAHQAGRIAS
ncbi:MAG TPA: M3 family oligoendopeptidase [Acidimicrobiales bacterium]|nr:M3 family oligoendopeptidase [Acidimicrobiales bacterium]